MTEQMAPQVANDYSAWKLPHHAHATAEDFAKAFGKDTTPAIHTVGTGGVTVDLLVSGDVTQGRASVPIFLNGRVPNREEKVGPFFSGGRVGPHVAPGHLALSDPTVDRFSDVSLAWYAGHGDDSTRVLIDQILSAVHGVLERELTLVGGASGGFAALYHASRATVPVSVFTWNPQTDILAYNRNFVDAYVVRAHPDHFGPSPEPAVWRAQREQEASSAGLGYSVVDPHVHRADAAHRLLYVQNATDWHLASHTVPYLQGQGFTPVGDGSFIVSTEHCVQVAEWGDGHAPLPHDMVVDYLSEFLRGDQTALDLGRSLSRDTRCRPEGRQKAPMDLRPVVSQLTTTIRVTRAGRAPEVTVDSTSIPPGYGGLKWGLIQTKEGQRSQLAWFGNSTRVTFDPAAEWSGSSLLLVVRDGYNHHLCHLPVEEGRAPNTEATEPATTPGSTPLIASTPRPVLPAKTFIYGSCVTRDSFELVDRSSVSEYVARSPFRSALGQAPETLPETMDLDRLSSPFQRRMVTWDVEKQLPRLLSTVPYDIVVIDLIDERLRVQRVHNGVLAVSSESVAAGLVPRVSEVMTMTDPDYFDEWKNAAETLCRILDGRRVVLNRVLWAEQDSTGSDLTAVFPVRTHNEALAQMYDYLADRLDCPVITYPAEVHRADPDHRWGLSPFHFVPEFYEHFMERFRTLLAETRS